MVYGNRMANMLCNYQHQNALHMSSNKAGDIPPLDKGRLGGVVVIYVFSRKGLN